MSFSCFKCHCYARAIIFCSFYYFLKVCEKPRTTVQNRRLRSSDAHISVTHGVPLMLKEKIHYLLQLFISSFYFLMSRFVSFPFK